MSDKVTVRSEPTPNPQSMKFVLDRAISTVSAEFKSAREATYSPLAKKLFGFPWTDAVFVGPDFVTVTKQEWVDWDTLSEPLASLIGEHFERGEPALTEAPKEDGAQDGDPVVMQIKKVLNEEIRPAVAMDGGDIVFHKYENNTVYLFMQGACAGCPSSTATLRFGIEARLKEAIPEIKEVVSLN